MAVNVCLQFVPLETPAVSVGAIYCARFAKKAFSRKVLLLIVNNCLWMKEHAST